MASPCPTAYRRFTSREAALTARGAMAKRDESAAMLTAMWCAQCSGVHLVSEPERLLEVRGKPARTEPAATTRAERIARENETKRARVREVIAKHLATKPEET